MKLAALTLIAFGLVLAVLFCFTGPISRTLCPELDDTKRMLGQGAVEFPKPDFGLVSSLGSLMPHACRAKGNPQTRVWVNTRSGFYYCPNTPLYGRIEPGLYMVQTTALQHGYQPALKKPCP